ncbi:hypothetical protein [Streptomyces halstedii]|uniref:Uncharacterized protein n=1 Tax=Streptomyces halstedii TaxID=1944 RepID=A0A6N9U9K0_STRHA|nr:hypothetical protein [Streptomyces halstedii]NEA19379.1 hypothetical protein [Streptomyces halstedii]
MNTPFAGCDGLDRAATAASQLSGERLTHVRQRLHSFDTYTGLIPDAGVQQALLESLVLSALGRPGSENRRRMLGVEEVWLDENRLRLRVEDVSVVQAILEMLPVKPRRGTRRGVRELSAEAVGKDVFLSLRGVPSPHPLYAGNRHLTAGVHVQLLGATCSAQLLDELTMQVTTAGGTPEWSPNIALHVPGRRPPIERCIAEQHAAGGGLASSLLRRSHLWDSLVGQQRLTVQPTMVDHGLEWVVSRTMSPGVLLHDKRLHTILTDQLVGPGLRSVHHACTATECTAAYVPRNYGGQARSEGSLLITSRHAANQVGSSSCRRTLLALGEQPTSHPNAPRVQRMRRPGDHVVVGVRSVGALGLDSWEARRFARQTAAAWAVDGYRVAVIVADEGSEFCDVRVSNRRWGKRVTTLPYRGDEPPVRWRRSRLAPFPGELWRVEVDTIQIDIEDAIQEARDRCERVIAVDATRYMEAGLSSRADQTLVINRSRPFERHVAGPAGTTLALSPDLAAARWHERELSGKIAANCSGVVLVDVDLSVTSAPVDDYDREVERHLACYGTPILARQWLSSGQATVLDPMEATEADQLRKQADELADILALARSRPVHRG